MRGGAKVILVTAIGSMSAACVIRQLRLIRDVIVIGCDLHPADWIHASTQVDSFYSIASSGDAAAYLDDLHRICTQEGVDYVIPLTDPEVDILCTRQGEFYASSGAVICVSAPEALEKARDKIKLAECFEGSSAVPTLPGMAAETVALDSFLLPVLFKPRKGRSSQGQFTARSVADLTYALTAFRDAMYCAQPLLSGQVFVADVVHQPLSGSAVAVCREELIRTSNGAGMTVRMVVDPELQALSCSIARHIGIQGCVNIEFLKVKDQYLLMDLNPRFSAGVAFSVLAGYDMVRAHLDCFSGQPIVAATHYKEQIYTRSIAEVAAAAPH